MGYAKGIHLCRLPIQHIEGRLPILYLEALQELAVDRKAAEMLPHSNLAKSGAGGIDDLPTPSPPCVNIASKIPFVQYPYACMPLAGTCENAASGGVGALGGRLDHTISNLAMLHRFSHLQLTLCGDGNLARLVQKGKSIISIDPQAEGPMCALFPLCGPATASTTGLKWNLGKSFGPHFCLFKAIVLPVRLSCNTSCLACPHLF